MAEQIRYSISPETEPIVAIKALVTRNILYGAKEYEPDMEIQPWRVNYGVAGIAGVRVDHDGNYRVIVPLGQIGRRRREDKKQAELEAATRTLAAVEYAAQDLIASKNRPLSFELGQYRLPDGQRLGLNVRLKKPNAPNSILSNEASNTMRRIAVALHYVREPEEPKSNYEARINDLVYADYNSERGVVLETNSMGSCSIGTDGSEYQPKDVFMELYSHNLYNREQQLICLAGAIAISEWA